ncbi:MAG: GIY-YIG nuclease family protein [Micavibrio aeruginosavorus]|nr:GIY-YIG nuclease family protein [Micavibrio aeruginosavorus]
MRNYYVYMMTNKSHRVLYTGMTNDLIRRVSEHKSGIYPGFTQRYKAHKLVYFEHTFDVNSAIAREKQIKGWIRARKNALVAATNPEWNDLYDTLTGDPSLRSG